MSSVSFQSLILLVDDTDEAISFFVDQLGFQLVENLAKADGSRWVKVASGNGEGASIVLKQATGRAQASLVGQQAGDGVLGIITVEEFHATYEKWLANGVNFIEPARYEPYGTVAIFCDLYGNKWDLIGPPRHL
ncbi:VOC family protein [Salinimonas sediminis]|uniref:VOC family protein n=1 Tax=Salinimonas sediminis TaxID=2303538 RepID=A0A346NHV8_9ALTE|nr:VOC family protein [Salinimonas sediminis]AXR05115.1 VOC family protein [Salinimonas sediminis]